MKFSATNDTSVSAPDPGSGTTEKEWVERGGRIVQRETVFSKSDRTMGFLNSQMTRLLAQGMRQIKPFGILP